MKINKIKIQNFRSIKDAEFIVSDFNIFVGQNNCGKPNFFESIEFFFNGVGKSIDITNIKYQRNQELEIIVEIEFSGALDGAEKMINDKNKATILKSLNDSDIVTIRRSSIEHKKRLI